PQRGIRSSGKLIKMVDHTQGWQACCEPKSDPGASAGLSRLNRRRIDGRPGPASGRMGSVEEDYRKICCNLRDFVAIVPVESPPLRRPAALLWPLSLIEGETWGGRSEGNDCFV